MQYINDLKPRAITRDSDWGIPVPGYPGKVFYVWFDAPIGYISMTQEWAIQQGKAEIWKDYWLNPDCKLVHFIGKDNIPFHAVFFPAMLMGQDESYILPDQIPANEFLNLEGRQFSKSDGWYIDLEDFFKQYTADQARYSIAANAPETSDSEFSWKDFQMRCNSELLGKLGNFVNRVLVFINQHGEGMVSTIGECEEGLQKQMQHLVAAAALSFESFHLRKATQILMELASLGNAYFDHQKPWALAKDPKRKDKLKTVLGMSVECIKNLALVASPMIPETAQKIWEMLGFQTELARGSWEKIHKTPVPEGQKLGKVEVLFQKVEDMEIEKQMEKLGESVAMHEHPSLQPLKAEVSYGDFDKMDFRIGQIVAAEKVAKSKKLLKLLVDLGFTQRTVVSGISLHYKPEDLIGKKVVVVANLQPTKIMGIESAGMILAASIGDQLELPYIQCLPPGSKVV